MMPSYDISIKICGLSTKDAVQTVIDCAAHYAGFVYYPASPRHIEPADAAILRRMLPASIPAVSVLVDPSDALLAQIAGVMQPDYFQLHGKETPERLSVIRAAYPDIRIIKALSISTGDDVAQAAHYNDVCDMLLFDAKAPKLPGMLPGGNGLSFDWALLKNREFDKSWFLSGGLHIENITEALRETGAKMVDISSGVESAPGVKDPALIEAFIHKVRSI